MTYETKQSKLVYEFLKFNLNKHFSAEEVYYGLISDGNNIGRTTVYRQLDRLCDEGKATKFFSGENNSCCYQFRSDECSRHYHLKCSSCGKLIHTQCEFLDNLSRHIFNDHNFTIDDSKTVLYGICKDCGKECVK